MREATLPEIRDYFQMDTTTFKKEWMVLDDAEKEFFKEGVGAVLAG